MSVDPASFKNDETCNNLYTKINKTFKLDKMDLVRELYIYYLVSLKYD